MLGQVEGIDGWHSVDAYPGRPQIPGIVVYRWEAPLFFANAGMFRQQIRRLVRDRHPSWIVLQCEAITDIDVTAAEMLEQLDDELNADGVHLAFVEMRSRLQDLALRYGLFETLDRDHFYPTLKAPSERSGNSGLCLGTGRRAMGTDTGSRVRAGGPPPGRRPASPSVVGDSRHVSPAS